MYPSSIATIQNAQRAVSNTKKRRVSAAPSPRAQEIFRRVEVNCEKQCDVAGDLKISPGRVSQHVSRVRAWLGAGSPGDAQTMAHFDQQRLERSLAKDRHTLILQMAIRELRRLAENQKHITTKVEEGDKTKVTTTAKDQALSVQHMKIAQKAITELQKLAELEPLPQPRPALPDEGELFVALYDVLYQWRQRAEHAGHVAPSNSQKLVRCVIAALLGRNPEPLPLDPALREFFDGLLGRVGQACEASAGPPQPKATGDREQESARTERRSDGETEVKTPDNSLSPSLPPSVPPSSAWQPIPTPMLLTGMGLGPAVVRHPAEGPRDEGQASGETARRSDRETEGKTPDHDPVSPSFPLSVPPSSSAATLLPPKDASPPSPPTRPPETSATNPTSTASSASSAVNPPHPPSSDEKIKNITPIPPVTPHITFSVSSLLNPEP
jgi:hypothetical protein